MGKHNKSRGFNQFKGLTIKSVDTTSVNNVEFIFTNGQTISISREQVGIIRAEKIKGFAATHEVIANGKSVKDKTIDYPHLYSIGQKVARSKGSKDEDGDFLYKDSAGGTQWLK